MYKEYVLFNFVMSVDKKRSFYIVLNQKSLFQKIINEHEHLFSSKNLQSKFTWKKYSKIKFQNPFQKIKKSFAILNSKKINDVIQIKIKFWLNLNISLSGC